MNTPNLNKSGSKSKFAVISAQCGNYIIFLSLRFCVKSKLANLDSRVSKCGIFTLESLNFNLYDFKGGNILH